MTGPLRWPRRRDWPRWLVASIDPQRPAEITAPIPLRQCAVCAEDDRHVWSEVDAERIGAVVLRRLACVCDRCGRCDAQTTEVHVDRGSAAMTSVPGLGKLIDEYDGNPATLRWLSIHTDGRVVDRESDNRIGWSTQHEMWVQWRLVRDVYREVEPTSHGYSLSVAVLIPTRHGVVITARDNSGPDNPVATGMLAALGVEHEARGTVAWLAEAHAETGLHGDLDDEHRAALRAVATQHGGTSGRAE